MAWPLLKLVGGGLELQQYLRIIRSVDRATPKNQKLWLSECYLLAWILAR